MPPKTGPAATVPKASAKAASTKDEPKDEPEEAAVDSPPPPPEDPPVVTTGGDSESEDGGDDDASDEDKAAAEAAKIKIEMPDLSSRELLIEMYPEETPLWFAEINKVAFAFPKIVTITPPRQWLRAIYQLTELAQSFEWMNLAKVPLGIQNRTDLLSDVEYDALFRAWYVDGEVDLPK